MLFRTRTLALTGLLLALFAAAPAPAQAADGSETSLQDGRRRRRQRRRPPVPQQAEALLKSLKVSPEQKALVRAEALRAAPLVENARQHARALIQQARANGTPPAEVRERLRALRAETLDTLTVHGRRLVASLTPEQREQLAERAARHGKTFDAERLAGRITRLVARPRLLERIQQRAERRGER